jgi:hypothetical protein
MENYLSYLLRRLVSAQLLSEHKRLSLGLRLSDSVMWLREPNRPVCFIDHVALAAAVLITRWRSHRMVTPLERQHIQAWMRHFL